MFVQVYANPFIGEQIMNIEVQHNVCYGTANSMHRSAKFQTPPNAVDLL